MDPISRKTLISLAVAVLTLQSGSYAQSLSDVTAGATVVEAVDPAEARFSYEQIQQMVAPIALYPDTLLAQTLMAATYPLEVAQAAQWRRNHPKLDGAALDDALAEQPWDASVKTLVLFPEVLDRMAGDLAWTQDLGEAYLAQEVDVMAAVQDLRRQAEDAGNLLSNDQQVVRKTGSTIVVEPADPAVVYVPSYNPTVVYGSGFTPVMRSTYYPTVYRSYDATPSWVVFGAGVAVGALLTAIIDWNDDDDYYYVSRRYWPRPHHRHIYYYGPSYWSSDWVGPRYGAPAWRSYRPTYVRYGDVNIDKSRTINIERNTVIQNNVNVRPWEHAPVHRAGAAYRDPTLAKRFQKPAEPASAPRLRDEGSAARLPREPSGDRSGALPVPGSHAEGQRPRPDAFGSARLGRPDEPLKGEPGRQLDRPFDKGLGRRELRQPGQEPPPAGLGSAAGERPKPGDVVDGGRSPELERRLPQDIRRNGVDQASRRSLGRPAGEAGTPAMPPPAKYEPPRPQADSERWQRSMRSQQQRQPIEAAPRPEQPRSNYSFGGRERPQSMPEAIRQPPPQAVPRVQDSPRPDLSRRPTYQPAERVQAPPQQRIQAPPQQRIQAPPQQRIQAPPPAPRAQPPQPQSSAQQREERKRNPFKPD